MNANEIANGVLSALVAITAGCPFVGYWGACLTGSMFTCTESMDCCKIMSCVCMCRYWSVALSSGLLHRV